MGFSSNRAVLVLTALAIPAVALSLGETKSASVCDASAHPDQYGSSLVAVEARVEDNGMDRSALVDPTCPRDVLELVTTETLEKTKEFARLNEILYRQGLMGTLGKKVTGRFIGRLTSKKEGWPRVAMNVEQIENLSVEAVPIHPPTQ